MNHHDRGIDFSGIRAANPIADTIGRYLQLTKRGGEYIARCPFHNDSNPSFAVVPKKEKAFCNACNWHGDVIDFVAAFEGIATSEAARRLSDDELPRTRPALPPLPPDEAEEWTPVLPAPDGAPLYDPAKTYNPRRGKTVNWSRALTRADEYRDAAGRLLGYVVRMDIDGAKLTPTVTWCRHADGRECWASTKFPSPRPLQGLDDLAANPDRAVLVVSGEKCREAAAHILPGFVAVTWPGGDNNVDKADWMPLAGRRVTIWPDADPSGWQAAQTLAGHLWRSSAEVRVIAPDGQAKGWDIADAVADGWDRARIVEWVKPRVSAWLPEGDGPGPSEGAPAPYEPVEEVATAAAPAPNEARGADIEPVAAAIADQQITLEPREQLVDLPSTTPADYATASWEKLGLELSNNGAPSPNLTNAAAILERHPLFQGQFWFDEFLGRVLTTWNARGIEQEWSDADDVRLALTIQRFIRIGRMAVGTVRDAVTAVAMAHKRNEAQDWIRSLRWDGEPRLSDLVPIGFGAERNAYSEAVGRCWLISMVARVMRPGCKVDTMPVFEGIQGKKKSTALEVLVGSRWFAEAAESPTTKDFFQALQGKMLIEIGEMDAFSKAEVHTIKRVISCKSDRYRAPYGRRSEDHPRMCVFAGTTNKDDWNRDETGARRFWPIAAGEVDTPWLAINREQLFAEAVVRYEAGESWWDVPADDALREQEARRDSDEWENVISLWLLNCGRHEVTVGDVLLGALKMEPDDWDKASQMRAAKAVKACGWFKQTVWRGGKTVKIWTAEEGGKGGNDFLL